MSCLATLELSVWPGGILVFSAPTWAIRREGKPSGFRPEDHWFDSSMAYKGDNMDYYIEGVDHLYKVIDMDGVISHLKEEELCELTKNAMLTYSLHEALDGLERAGILIKEFTGDGYEPTLEEYKATADVLREAVCSKYGESRLQQIEQEVENSTELAASNMRKA